MKQDAIAMTLGDLLHTGYEIFAIELSTLYITLTQHISTSAQLTCNSLECILDMVNFSFTLNC
jgi:hypothetical protein